MTNHLLSMYFDYLCSIIVIAVAIYMVYLSRSYQRSRSIPDDTDQESELDPLDDDPFLELVEYHAQDMINRAHYLMEGSAQTQANYLQAHVSQSLQEWKDQMLDLAAQSSYLATIQPIVLNREDLIQQAISLSKTVLTAGAHHQQATETIASLIDRLFGRYQLEPVLCHLVQSEPQLVSAGPVQEIRHATSLVIWSIAGDVYLLDLRVDLQELEPNQAPIWDRDNPEHRIHRPQFHRLSGSESLVSGRTVQLLQAIGPIWYATDRSSDAFTHARQIEQVHDCVNLG